MTTIIFALLAAFVVWKLRSVLGTRTGTEKPPRNPFAGRATGSVGAPGDAARGQVIPLPGAADATLTARQENEERWKPYAEPGSKAWAGLDAIAAAHPAFAIKPFIDGAKAAYEMILTAFAEGKRDVLRNLLAADVLAGFTAAIEGRERRGETLSTTLVSIDETAIEDATLVDNTAEIKVRYAARMITVTRDGSGSVIEGDPDKAVQVADVWTFSRDVRSRDPNWKLTATGTAQ
jgi:predicted lipid-binding transport protein (Tim44 family)